MFSKFFALIFLVLLSPLIFLLFILVKLSSKGPFIFKQLRAGKYKKPFYMYKIRTMVKNAEDFKKKYLHLNEADGPVFKIRNDPRYTKIGKILSYSGLDEIPQLINILKGEMAFVGPRPLPVDEAEKVAKRYNTRFSILPGITSPWVVNGSHRLTFKQWMELDLDYLEKKSFLYDLKITLLTVKIMAVAFLYLCYKTSLAKKYFHAGKTFI